MARLAMTRAIAGPALAMLRRIEQVIDEPSRCNTIRAVAEYAFAIALALAGVTLRMCKFAVHCLDQLRRRRDAWAHIAPLPFRS